jgi:CDP-glucose 4,6-dehydratase
VGRQVRAMEGVALKLEGWRERSVFMTGHTGFKGAWASLWLERLGARVTGYALPPDTQPSLFDLAGVRRSVESIEGDVRDSKHLYEALQAAQPEVVLHLAAQSLVRRSYAQPADTYAINVTGTVNLLDAVRQCPTVRAVVIVTSDKCYENREVERGYVEADPLGGFDPYSSSKACAEIVTASYRRSFFSGPVAAAIASVRAGNVIGGGDWAQDRLVPDLVRAFQSGRPALLRNPEATRPWQHVLDPLAGYLVLADRLLREGGRFARAWNFGPDQAGVASVGELAAMACQAWGPEARWERDSGAQPHEARMLTLDAGLARRELGWAPRLALQPAVQATVSWYRKQAAGGNARELCLADIDSYMARAAA